MNNFSPDQLYTSIQARHEDIRNAEANRHVAKMAQNEQPSRLTALVQGIRGIMTHPAETTSEEIVDNNPSNLTANQPQI